MSEDSPLLDLPRSVIQNDMRCLIFIVLALIIIAGCKPDAPVVDRSAAANAGVNIVPQAILASQTLSPDTTQLANPTSADLVRVISDSQQHHEKILRALQAADLIKDLQAVGPFTVLLPTDEAFNKLPPGWFERLLQPQNKPQLRAVLNGHLIGGRIALKTMLDTNGQVKTLAEKSAVIRNIDGKIMVNDANVIRAESGASNGVIYWLDGVLVPSI